MNRSGSISCNSWKPSFIMVQIEPNHNGNSSKPLVSRIPCCHSWDMPDVSSDRPKISNISWCKDSTNRIKISFSDPEMIIGEVTAFPHFGLAKAFRESMVGCAGKTETLPTWLNTGKTIWENWPNNDRNPFLLGVEYDAENGRVARNFLGY
jgi:hypothetical protein